MECEHVMIAWGVERPGPPVRTLNRSVKRGYEVRPNNGASAGLRQWMAVELHQAIVREFTGGDWIGSVV